MVFCLGRRTETVLALATGVDGCTSGVRFVGRPARPAFTLSTGGLVLPPSLDSWLSRARTPNVVPRSAY